MRETPEDTSKVSLTVQSIVANIRRALDSLKPAPHQLREIPPEAEWDRCFVWGEGMQTVLGLGLARSVTTGCLLDIVEGRLVFEKPGGALSEDDRKGLAYALSFARVEETRFEGSRRIEADHIFDASTEVH